MSFSSDGCGSAKKLTVAVDKAVLLIIVKLKVTLANLF
jgi:hypothetical protein